MHELKAFFLSLNQDKLSGWQADLQAQVAGKGRWRASGPVQYFGQEKNLLGGKKKDLLGNNLKPIEIRRNLLPLVR